MLKSLKPVGFESINYQCHSILTQVSVTHEQSYQVTWLNSITIESWGTYETRNNMQWVSKISARAASTRNTNLSTPSSQQEALYPCVRQWCQYIEIYIPISIPFLASKSHIQLSIYWFFWWSVYPFSDIL